MSMKYWVIFFALFNHSLWALPEAIEKTIKLDIAKEIFKRELEKNSNLEKPKIAIHDVSFFGHKILLKKHMPFDYAPPEMGLMSPHGVSVAQIISDSKNGVLDDQKINVLTKGIFIEDFERAIGIWERQKIKIVNLSMRFRSPAIIEALNGFIKRGGIVIASSGNSALRQGIELPEYYQSFQGLAVSASDLKGELLDFSQYDKSLSVLAPGEIGSYPTNRIVYTESVREEPTEISENIRVQEHGFGMTSSSAPVVTGLVTMALTLDPNLKQQEINLLLKNSATLILGRPLVNAEKFLNQVMIYKSFKKFFFRDYRALMCSDNVFTFKEVLKREGVNLTDSSVLHIRKTAAPLAPLIPMNPRNPGEKWTFHAFMKLGGLVLDFDYSNSPTLIDIKNYKESMWADAGLILFQEKPIEDYTSSDLFGSMNPKLFPWTVWPNE